MELNIWAGKVMKTTAALVMTTFSTVRATEEKTWCGVGRAVATGDVRDGFEASPAETTRFAIATSALVSSEPAHRQPDTRLGGQESRALQCRSTCSEEAGRTRSPGRPLTVR